MEESILKTKEIINEQVKNKKIIMNGKAFSLYQKIYFSTNENIKEYLKLINFNNKNNALSVLASGDHTFNLISNSIKNIDTFDTNCLTEYYVLGLKRAMILKYNYNEYIIKLNLLVNELNNDNINEIILETLPYMENKYKIYWKSILDYTYLIQKNNKEQLNLIKMLFINIKNNNEFNKYLINETEYNKFKTNLINSNITFKCENALNLYSSFNNKYDIILLSNILDYFNKIYGYNWNINKLNEYINSLKSITKQNGIIFVNYIYNYYSKLYRREKSIIQNSNITINDLNDYTVSKLPFYKKENKLDCGDGIIIKKLK